MKSKVTIVVPVYNGGVIWSECASRIKSNFSGQVIVIDSSSTDDSAQIALDNGFELHVIPSSEFNHGKTRNDGIMLANDDTEIIIFLTQDCLLEGTDSILNIIAFLESDSKLAAVYGRQLPHDDANPISRHARYYNYPLKSYVTSFSDSNVVGIKKAFLSNSFSAYKINALKTIGFFPVNTILCEDMFFAARSLQNGYKIGYAASAVAKHSHNYSAAEEFKRYFDIGVFHATESWISESFGGAGGEGKRFIKSELKYLLKYAPLWLPKCTINNVAKICGYKLGKKYKSLPSRWIKCFSMHRKYWE